MRKTGLVLCLTVLSIAVNAAVTIVENGAPKAEIIIAEDALPQVQFAAREFRDHVKRMSGAELSIVNAPTDTGRKPIYVGESEFTKKLGLTTGDLKMEGYKVVATDDYLAMLGNDAVLPEYPRGHKSRHDREKLLKEWWDYCGEKWDFPMGHIYDPRNFNKELGFSLYDPTGTLYAVYDVLERFGVRWYMPHHDFGTVIPERKDLTVDNLSVAKEPVFAQRYLRIGWGKDTPTFLWFKRQKLGMSEPPCIYHGAPNVTRFAKNEHPEYFSIIDGKHRVQNWGGTKEPGHPRLKKPLSDAMIRYADKYFTRYPELRRVSAAPADGYIAIDDRDKAAGYWRENRGRRGLFSDYVWKFVNDVAKGVKEKHPDKIVSGLAYSTYRLPPEDFDSFEPNVGVVFCQSRCKEMIDPEERKEIFKQREEWMKRLPSKDFHQWEYFLFYRNSTGLLGVPVLFNEIAQEDMRALAGKSKGEYVEAYPQGGKYWGLKHLPYHVQARLYWNPDLDMDALMDEYCELFYGPAKAEMREFFDVAEEVWTRPKSRDLLGDDGFLQPADVDRFFDILARAKAKAGGGDFEKRVNLLIKECQPMKEIFAFKANHAKGMAAIKAKDGEAAETYLKRAAAQAPDPRSEANCWFELGDVYRDAIKDDEKALDAYRKCMKVHFKGAGAAVRMHARMSVVAILRRQKRFDEAIKELDDFSGAKRHDYWNIRKLTALGEIAAGQGDLEKAATLYQEALNVQGIKPGQEKSLKERLKTVEERMTPQDGEAPKHPQTQNATQGTVKNNMIK